MTNLSPSQANKQVTAGFGGIILGALGVHKFILGYNTEGVIMLAIALVGGYFTYGLALLLLQLLGLVEGMTYLNMSSENFIQTYIVNKRRWL